MENDDGAQGAVGQQAGGNFGVEEMAQGFTLALQRANLVGHRDVLKPTPFSGTTGESFATFRTIFRRCAQVNHWNEQTQAMQLVASLRSEALLSWERLSEAEKANAELALEGLNALYGEVEALLGGVDFRECRQQIHETVKEYVRRLTAAFHSAYAARFTPDLQDLTLREQFTCGLLPVLRDEVLRARCASFRDATVLAEREEAIRRFSGGAFSSLGSGLVDPMSVGAPQVAFSITARERKLEDEVADLKKQVATITQSASKWENGLAEITRRLDDLKVSQQQGQRRQNFPEHTTVRCYACSGPHLVRECTVGPQDLRCDICKSSGRHNTQAHDLYPPKNGGKRITRS
jgi:hypothetical protein